MWGSVSRPFRFHIEYYSSQREMILFMQRYYMIALYLTYSVLCSFSKFASHQFCCRHTPNNSVYLRILVYKSNVNVAHFAREPFLSSVNAWYYISPNIIQSA